MVVGRVVDRRPELIREAFGARMAKTFEPLGFKSQAKGNEFVRKQGKNRHRIQLDLRDTEGGISVTTSMTFFDGLVRKTEKHWEASVGLGETPLVERQWSDVKSDEDVSMLVARIAGGLDYFTLFESPERVFEEVSRRYLPGLVTPLGVAPYLRLHLGDDAVLSYVEWMLANRPELWPSFAAGAPAGTSYLSDHGSQLAAVAKKTATQLEPPRDTAATDDRAPRSLRDFFGLQLRAWGEPAAAAKLRVVPDASIVATRKAQEGLKEILVDSPKATRVLLQLVGEDRDPTQEKPMPRYFQYHVLHRPFR